MAPILECRNFSFYIGSNHILDNISFRLERGGWLSIIGPNGSGKSTLLKNFMRLVAGHSTGELRINDRPVASYSQKELARLLAYVPQAGGNVPPFTVGEFVNLSRYPLGFCSRSAQACESIKQALELTNTTHLARSRLDTLSGGQRQRVFLAAALAQDADVLLLDEPSSFLDPRHAHELNELLKRLPMQKDMTIVTVTHDLSQPLDAGGMTLVLCNSHQIHFGSAQDLLGHGILEKAFDYEFSYIVHPRTGKTVVVA